MSLELDIKIDCECGNRIKLSGLRDSYISKIIVCPKCHRRYRIRIEPRMIKFPIANVEAELEEFENWLYSKHNLVSASVYKSMLKKYLNDPNKFPRTFAPLDYFIEFIEEKYGEETAQKVRRFLYFW